MINQNHGNPLMFPSIDLKKFFDIDLKKILTFQAIFFYFIV